MTIDGLLQKADKRLAILEGTFGLERESLRMCQKTNHVAKSAHPTTLGSRDYHPYIQTDFSEAQLELITPVASSTTECLRWLKAISDVAYRSIDKDEYLWPLSMPACLNEDDIDIAQLTDPSDYQYRQYLAKQYGKTLQSMSGIHFNIALDTDILDQLFILSDYEDRTSFQNELYLKIAQNFLRYRWLLTYLYGASPIAEKGFLKTPLTSPVRSIRSSHLGYVNHKDLSISYESIKDYVETLTQSVSTGQLIAEKEHYSPVRFRGQKSCQSYLEYPISYLECRSFDLNPYTPLAISQETLDTTHLFILALLWLDSPQDITKTLIEADQLNNLIALSHPLEALPKTAPVDEIITAMSAIITAFGLDDYYQDLLNTLIKQVNHPKLTIAGQLLNEITEHSLEDFGKRIGQTYHADAFKAPYALKGFEHMELSTQMLMFDAIQKGINLDILDEDDQFLKLWHHNHIEWVKNANMTSKDNYVVPLAMANKVVTKKILAEKGFKVPLGKAFEQKKDALNYYTHIRDKTIVVKPKSTNFGLGISIFKKACSFEDYGKALDIAFAEDSSILVEEYIEGTEYRFFVLDGKCEAVLLRLPANVVGDAKHTIAELVALKNQNPLRGYDHRSPLEIIQLGDIERLMLAQEGYNVDSVVEAGVKVNLRRNSNISTGGDSVDVTDTMPDYYKDLASQMASAMGAWACGVDLIIPDEHLKHPEQKIPATCIELNFNPSMYMHTYCQEGPGQAITRKILDKLFPEC